MIEASHIRKNKIQLSDYNFERDIQNRLYMSQFSSMDLNVLEEILYNSTKIPKKRLLSNLELSLEALDLSLEKLKKTGLLTEHQDILLVDKELRKYFEFQIKRFEPDFKADMEFLQNLLKAIPIHVLPNWYAIPRTSNNIFESMIEKYLQTPQVYHRYLTDLYAQNPIFEEIGQKVFKAPDFSIEASELQNELALSNEAFEELLIKLELSFVASVQFIQDNLQWKKILTPFHEWKSYLRFLYEGKCTPIQEPDAISPKRPGNFAFVKDMSTILSALEKSPIHIEMNENEILIPQETIEKFAKDCGYFELSNPVSFLEAQTYLTHAIEKLCMIDLIDYQERKLFALPESKHWLSLTAEEKALYLYRHPSNHLLNHNLPEELLQEKHIRDIEKTLRRVSRGGWVYFDDFLRGAMIPLNKEGINTLKKTGKNWEYVLPKYSDDEKELIRSVILEWLYEVGMVNVGEHKGKDCFSITSLGQTLFEDLPVFANL